MTPLALVTGASGFIGGHVAADLLSAGWDVRALVRPGSPRAALVPAGCTTAAGDMTDAAAVARAARGVDAVVHVAARYSLSRARGPGLERANVEGTRVVLTAAARADVPMVHTSSVATIGLPPDGRPGDEDTPLAAGDLVGAYKRSKLASERLALDAAAAGQHDDREIRPRGLCLDPVGEARVVLVVQCFLDDQPDAGPEIEFRHHGGEIGADRRGDAGLGQNRGGHLSVATLRREHQRPLRSGLRGHADRSPSSPDPGPTKLGTPRSTPWNSVRGGPTLRPAPLTWYSRMVFSCWPARFLITEIARRT